MPRANMDDLLNLKMPIPPLPEQRRIAAILNEQMASVERARAATEAQLGAAKALPTAYLRAAFNSPEAKAWPRRRLGEVCEFESGQFISRSDILSNGSVPVYGANGVIGYTSDACFQEPRIVVGRVGSCGAVNRTDGPAWITDNTLICRPTELADFGYIAWFLMSVDFGMLRSSSIQPLITQSTLKSLAIPLPPLPDQQRITTMLNEQMATVERTRKTLEEQLDTINNLPAALLRRAFRGEL